jgi:hypothetical protein
VRSDDDDDDDDDDDETRRRRCRSTTTTRPAGRSDRPTRSRTREHVDARADASSGDASDEAPLSRCARSTPGCGFFLV